MLRSEFISKKTVMNYSFLCVLGLQLAKKCRDLIISAVHCNSMELAEAYDFEARCHADCGKCDM